MGGEWVGVAVGIFSLGALGLVSKINFVEGEHKESLSIFVLDCWL